MKAAVNKIYGPPSVLKIEEVALPVIGATDVLIKVAYSGVNRTDDGFLRAKPFITRFFSGLRRPRCYVLGCEFAGEITKIGANVKRFKIGDKVFGFDDSTWGGHAEYKRIDANGSIALVPKNVSIQTAGVAGEGAHYALSYIYTLRKLNVQKVLVNGATGSIGSAAVQLMKREGWYVVATSTTAQYEKIKTLGPDVVIDWEKSDLTKIDQTFDAVFDAVGKSSFAKCKKLLNRRGVYISTELGPYAQNPLLGLVSPIFKLLGAKRALFPLPKNNKQVIEELASAMQDGSLVPLIDRTYALDQIKEAYEYVESGQKVGNVSLRINV